MQHVLSAEQFKPADLDVLFAETSALRELDQGLENRRELAQRHIGRQLCSLFYESSTRTRLSFEAAAVKFGMGLISTENAREFSSAAKGETIEDTIRVLNGYNLDVVVLRHHETGAANKAAGVANMQIINAGDGKGEHPTQALLDMFTIQDNLERLTDLKVVIGGDLSNGRTARSLAKLLAEYPGNKITFVSTPELQIGQDIKERLDQSDIKYEETVDMYDAIIEADVVYWTRLQKERLEVGSAPVSDGFVIDSTALQILPKDSIIMHPLPRVGEIASSVDTDPRAKYFEQAGNGLYIRMALLDSALAT